MSEFTPAVAKTLANEGGFFINTRTGEVANYGIGLWFLRDIGTLHGTGPASDEEIEYIKNLTTADATELYQEQFWEPGHFALLDAQPLADKAFDLAVNQGLVMAVALLQKALDVIQPQACEVDGNLGPLTAAACNSANPSVLYAAFIAQAANRYREIAIENPELAGDLPGWLARLNRP